MPAAAFAAPQPIKVVPDQVIKACPQKAMPIQKAAVCTRNIEVSGGDPKSGYRFSIREGTTLPPGIKLIAATGIVTATKDNPPVPASGTKVIQVTVTAGTRSANGKIKLEIDTSNGCSCPGLTAGFGDLPDARGAQPYGYALPVSGPSSGDALRPSYTWAINCGGLPKGACSLPPGMALDKTSGVLRGTPIPATSGHDFVFKVKITEKESTSSAISPGPFILHVD
jgi:hypothetical protein